MGSGSAAVGLILLIIAGAMNGSFTLPMKYTKKWAWENTWLGFASSAYLVWPWLLAFATLPHLGAVFATTSLRSLVLVEVFGLAWGLGALTFGLGVDILGIGLGFTIILGLAASAGTLIPLAVLFPAKLLQAPGLLTSRAK